MSTSKVLIVSHLFEPSVNAVIKHLESMRVGWARLNCEEFPLLAEGRVIFTESAIGATLKTTQGAICSEEISAVWYRRAAKAALPKNLSLKDRDFVRNECSSFLGGFFDLLDAGWMNDRDAERKATSKIRQLRIASSLGFRIPRTLITNQATAVSSFAASVNGHVIFKPVAGYSSRGADFSSEMQAMLPRGVSIEVEDSRNPEADVVFAQLLTPERLSAMGSLKVSPVIFQEFVEKRADIRVTIVGNKVFACRIMSQEREDTRVDFRRMVLIEGGESLSHEIFTLSEEIQRKCLLLMQNLGLLFGCIDLVESIDDEFIFLEINPSGQWLWIEHRTGAEISLAVAQELARMSQQGAAYQQV